MGNGADRILDRCIAEDIAVSGVFASDAFVRGQTFRSYQVHKYADIVKKYENFVIVIAFASESPIVLEDFYTLAAQHVFKRFGNVTAVGDFNVTVADGEFFTMLGPSGCGKTTTLRMVAGFETATEGEIYIGDKCVSSFHGH